MTFTLGGKPQSGKVMKVLGMRMRVEYQNSETSGKVSSKWVEPRDLVHDGEPAAKEAPVSSAPAKLTVVARSDPGAWRPNAATAAKSKSLQSALQALAREEEAALRKHGREGLLLRSRACAGLLFAFFYSLLSSRSRPTRENLVLETRMVGVG